MEVVEVKLLMEVVVLVVTMEVVLMLRVEVLTG